jgi:hypothetical protein
MHGIATLALFAVMVMLPCAVALRCMRHADAAENAAVERFMREEPMLPWTPESVPTQPMVGPQTNQLRVPSNIEAETRDVSPGDSGQRVRVFCTEPADAEVLKAQAIEARAHADTLAAIARAAAAKAEAAALEAKYAEELASRATQEMRRAA